MDTRVKQAVERFKEGSNCSQAVLCSYCQDFGLGLEQASRVATGFGGGMRTGDTCGAVTGALMVLGLKYGNTRPEDKQAKAKTYEMVLECASKFKARNGSVICRDLLGCDISTSEGMKEAQENGLFGSVCPKMVQDAAEILEEMLAENV